MHLFRSVPVTVSDEHGIDTRNGNTDIVWCLTYLSQLASYFLYKRSKSSTKHVLSPVV